SRAVLISGNFFNALIVEFNPLAFWIVERLFIAEANCWIFCESRFVPLISFAALERAWSCLVVVVSPAPPFAADFKLVKAVASWSIFDAASLDVASISICRLSISTAIVATSLSPILPGPHHLLHVDFSPQALGFFLLLCLFFLLVC